MDGGASWPTLEGAEVPAPPDFTVKALDCAATTIFAAGFAPQSRDPHVWVGELDVPRRRVAWTTKIPIRNRLEHDGERYLTLGADPDARGTRFSLSGEDEFSICDGVRVFERLNGRWVEQGRMEQPDGESDIGFGTPLLLRGPELITFESPGGPGVVHRYRQQRGSMWSRSALRLASAAAELGWQLVSLSSDALALTTEHRDGRSYVDFHARGPEGNLDPTQSVQLPEAPATMGATRDRVVVGLSRPAADGGSLVLIERREASWRLRGTVALPPVGPPSVGSMAVTSEHAAVWRGQLWLVALAAGTVTHRLVLPREHGAERPWPGAVLASCGGSVLAAAGPSLVLFDLTSIGR